jgi:hypothetical protein
MTFHDLHYGEMPLLLPNAWDRDGRAMPHALPCSQLQEWLGRYQRGIDAH